MTPFPPLYLVADPSCFGSPFDEAGGRTAPFFRAVREALAGGVRLLQYRDKTHTRWERYIVAERLRAMTRKAGAALIINDEIDLAMAVAADGVHLGQTDFPVWMARKLLGRDAVVGLSTHTLAQAVSAAESDVDYIGFGPIFATQTKSAHDPPTGIDVLMTIVGAVSLPVYAIGGIREVHLERIIATGVAGVAAASALSGDTERRVRAWLARLESGRDGE